MNENQRYERGLKSQRKGTIGNAFQAPFTLAHLPAHIRTRFVQESHAAMKLPEVREQMRKAGFEIVRGTPEQLAARLVSEIPAVKEWWDGSGARCSKRARLPRRPIPSL